MHASGSVLRRLLDEGLLDERSLVRGATVRDASSRNANTLICGPGDSGVFVKGGADPSDLEREASWYRHLGADPRTAHLAPALIAFLRDDGLLVVQAPAGAVDLLAHHRDAPHAPPAVGALPGQALAALHASSAPPVARDDPPPGVLSIHRPRTSSLAHHTPASVDLITLIQRHGDIGAALDRLREDWRPECPVHNDAKWSNLLLVPGAGHVPRRVKIVDWEHAGRGDAAWDVGSAMAGYLTLWLDSIPGASMAGDPAAMAAAARRPMQELRPGIAALWRAYETGPHPDRDRVAFLSASTAYAGARLILSAYESTQTSSEMGASAMLRVQVAANILADPGAAAERLLGLRPGSA